MLDELLEKLPTTAQAASGEARTATHTAATMVVI
jgi:hypothetical protein